MNSKLRFLIKHFVNRKLQVHFYLLVLIFLSDFSFGQSISIRFETDYAEFDMNSLRNLQNETTDLVASTLQIPLKNVDSFPASYSYQWYLSFYNTESIESGFIYEFSSCGARSDYRDYSGSYTINYLMKAHGIGLYLELRKQLDHSSNLVFGVKGFLIGSIFTLIENLKIYDITESQEIEAESGSLGFNPYIAIEYKISFVLFRCSIGYHINNNADLQISDSDETYLLSPKGSRINTNWSGLRAGIGVGIRID